MCKFHSFNFLQRPRTATQPLTSKISTSVYVLKLRDKGINFNEISTLGGRDPSRHST